MKEKEKEQNQLRRQTYNQYVKYSGLGVQMLATYLLAAWGGIKLDAYMGNTKFPAFTLIFLLLAVVSSMYLLIKSVNSTNKF